jgi:hypothetical protein
VAEARALAAQASRARAARSRVLPEESCGSTTSGGSPPARISRALIVVRFIHILIILQVPNYFPCTICICWVPGIPPMVPIVHFLNFLSGPKNFFI